MMPPVQAAFSHSSLSSFENCPRRYWFRYVRRIRVDREGIEAFVGKRVHEILERLYRFVDQGMVPSLPRVIWRYHQSFDEQYREERVHIVREGVGADFYRGLGVRCLANYYRRHYPFDGDETLGLEEPIAFALDPRGAYAVRGIIDRLVRARDGALEIHDFKTGRRVPSQEALDADRQLALYELGVRSSLGETGEVRLVWHYVLSDRVLTSRRTPDQLEGLRHAVQTLIDRIRGEREWEARTGPLCGWCEYRDMCPAHGGVPPENDADTDAAVDAALELQLQLL